MEAILLSQKKREMSQCRNTEKCKKKGGGTEKANPVMFKEAVPLQNEVHLHDSHSQCSDIYK